MPDPQEQPEPKITNDQAIAALTDEQRDQLRLGELLFKCREADHELGGFLAHHPQGHYLMLRCGLK